ncbi:hypothetical protein EDB86DRAFT_2815721 [Lactarius hatsudake]|nr:hypothetical protein EDB86DRAFT_2815721 [Lactarius hatsudake]
MTKLSNLKRWLRQSWVGIVSFEVYQALTPPSLECLLKDWNSLIYVFFKLTPLIEVINGHHVHVFECNMKHCIGKGNGRMVDQYLDTCDAKSTGNLRKHAKGCWGDEVVVAADVIKNVQAACDALEKVKSVDGSITAAFQCITKDKIT